MSRGADVISRIAARILLVFLVRRIGATTQEAYVINWVGFILTTVLVSLIPGANQLLGLRNAVRYGMVRAMIAVAGRLLAFSLFIGLVVIGLGAVLRASVEAFTVIKWAGVSYLLWIGLSTLRRSLRESELAPEPPPVATGRLVGQEFLVAITNPKAMLLFAALLPQFTSPGPESMGVQLAILGAAYLVIETVVALGYTAVGARIGGVGVVPGRVRRRLDKATGACFLGLAGYLALSSSG
ncbi:MAG TPA: LysE family transporter [Pseudonocardia sp.]|uniref:LysE family translocator n=1 Tax=Pseudonocardia sp. TaxID=60912 RepID=UPI002ED77265